MEFTRWCPTAQAWEKLFCHPIKIEIEEEEANRIIKEVLREEIRKEAIKLCVLYNMSYAEARSMVVEALVRRK